MTKALSTLQFVERFLAIGSFVDDGAAELLQQSGHVFARQRVVVNDKRALEQGMALHCVRLTQAPECQGEGEATAAVDLAFDQNFSVHRFNQAFGNTQAETRAAVFSGSKSIAPAALLKKTFDLLRSHANARILNGKTQSGQLVASSYLFNIQGDMTVTSELHGIREQVDQNLPEPECVT